MSKKKTPAQPLFDMYEDSPWISRNRELNTQAYDLYSQGLQDLGRQDNQYYEGIAGKAYQTMWDDYNRNYQNAVNKNLARNYGRTGSTASTSGSYITDSMQRQYNDMAANIAANQYKMYDQLVNSALNRDLAKLDQYGGVFNQSGNITEAVDRMNYNTRQQNKIRQWQNDVQREAEKTDWLKVGLDSAKGAFEGASQGAALGPWGMIGGAIGGGLSGAYDSYADPTGNYGYVQSSGSGLNLSSILGNKVNTNNTVGVNDVKKFLQGRSKSLRTSGGIYGDDNTLG